jgi:hypothetical protein
MSLGSLMGGMAQSGLSTYLGLSQNKRLQDEQDARNQQRQREEQDRATTKDAMSRVGKDDYTRTMQDVSSLTPEQAQVVNGWAQQQANGDAGLQRQLISERLSDSANGLDPVQAAAMKPTTYTQGMAYKDMAGKINDPRMAVAYAQMGEQQSKEDQLKRLFGASDKMFGGDLEGGLTDIANLHNTGVQNGYTSQVVKDPQTGQVHYELVNTQTGARQRFDPTGPLAQNALVMRAAAAIDPEKYAPLAQHAVNLWAQSGLTGQQQTDTAQHQDATAQIGMVNANNQGINIASEAQNRVGMLGVAQQNAGSTQMNAYTNRDYKNGVLMQYDQGLRGKGAAGIDPAKAEREKRAEQQAFIKENPNLYTIQTDPDMPGKPHAGLLGLTNNMLKATDAATTQQTLLAVQAQAAQVATDPATGKMDYNKYRQALDAISAEATRALAERMGAGVKPGNQQGTGGGVPAKEAPYNSQPTQKTIDGMKREKAKEDRVTGLKNTLKKAASAYGESVSKNPLN